MLRLDPAFPPLWRSPSTLQLGVVPIAVLHDPAPWEQRLLRALETGVDEPALDATAVAFGAGDGDGERFVRRLGRAVTGERAAPPPIALQLADPVDAALEAVLTAMLLAVGREVVATPWFGAPHEEPPSGAAVMVVAHGVVEPRRAAALVAADVPHLPIVFGAAAVEVGPLVVPGRTACLACLAAHRRDADPAWPLLAAQLLGRPAPPTDAVLAAEAAGVAERLLTEAERHPARTVHRSLTLRAGALHRTLRSHRPHAECRCRSLARSATPDGPVRRAPTSPTAFAVPA